MIFNMTPIDTEEGVQLTVSQRMNGVSDNTTQSLAAMWMARFYTELQVAHQQGHAYIKETEDGNRSIALH